MAYIKPFKGVVYNERETGDLSKVIAPPYDIIPKDMQNDLYRSSPYNIVRLELGKIKGSDSAADNRYTRSRRSFESWLRDKAMTQDKEESIYVILKDTKRARIA